MANGPQNTTVFKLVVHAGPSPGQEFDLARPELIIGRDPGVDIVIDSPAVSRRHARLVSSNGAYLLEDLGSSNGTFLNGRRLAGQSRLQPGDQITLGQAVSLTFTGLEIGPRTIKDGPPAGGEKAQTVLDSGPAVRPTGPQPILLVRVAGAQPASYPLLKDRISLGRSPDNDIVIPSDIVSRRHAWLEREEQGYRLVVLPEAGNPVLFEGRPLGGQRSLRHSDTLRIGSLDPGLIVTLTYVSPAEAAAPAPQEIMFGAQTKLQFGRDSANDVVLDAPDVSRFHAVMEKVGQRYRLRDLRSSNGTFVNGQQISGEAWLKPGDEARIGPFRFVAGREHFTRYDETHGLQVNALRLHKWVRKDLNILQDISLVLRPREFIVVVGQSGGGKSTLVDALSGYRPATHGRVLVNGVDIYQHFDAIRSQIGFVPQKDIIHTELTVYQALDYAGRLRMPPDTAPEERRQRVMEVLQDLDLVHRKDVQIGGLSGGQQKRVSIGVELLTRPGLFFLDEPTSGLDPATETALMHLMRRLADQGRTIVLITHATKNVMLADQVVFLARGGHLAWFGPPEEALQYFDQHRSERDRRSSPIEFDDLYGILDDPALGSAEDWARRYRSHPAFQKYILQPLKDQLQAPQASESGARSKPQAAGSRGTSFLRQFRILTSRNLKIITRDRISLLLMLATAPLVGLLDILLAVLLGRDPFSYQTGNMRFVVISLFTLAMYAILVGGMAQMREIVKEQEIYRRERLVCLKLLPYVFSKAFVLVILACYHAAAYTLIHYIAYRMPGGLVEFGLFYLTMALITVAGMMLGLFASALAPNANAAPLLVILLIVPQIILGGALVPVPRPISAVTVTSWGYAAFMAITGTGADVAGDACWDLPAGDRALMTLEQKETFGCRCLGMNLLDPASCNFPGIGEFDRGALDQPAPQEPPPLGDPPPEPVLPPRPPEPADPSDSLAMADFFSRLKTWEAEANRIQEAYRLEVDAYQSQARLYQAEVAAYQEQAVQGLLARQAVVKSAEALVDRFRIDYGWTFVDKSDSRAFRERVVSAWIAEITISGILLLGILVLLKRRDIV
jgi:ABC-type multidrug transport system ATPase subunit/pSer/pThr/pTyr-binding forkhead associated (FHA) protein